VQILLRRCLLILPLGILAMAPAKATPPEAPRDAGPPLPPPLPPPRPAELAPAPVSLPQPPAPESGATVNDCPASLLAEGATLNKVTMGAQSDSRCAIADPVRIESLALRGGQRVDLPDRPTVDCAVAQTLAHFVDEALEPLVKGTFNASMVALETGPGFECRTRDHIARAKLSEHANGLAIDIASITFAGGRVYHVGKLADEAERGFDHAVRAAACGYFHTALGPGADAFHASHWHLDLESRGRNGESKFCQ
jgi:hypothetical protein